MKKGLTLLIVSIITLLFTNCGGENTPAGIEKSIYTQLKNGNYEKAMTIMINNSVDYDQSAPEKPQIIKSFAQKAQQSTEAKGGIKSFEIGDESISEDGLSAVVEVKIVYGNGSEDTKKSFYIKKDNKWMGKTIRVKI